MFWVNREGRACCLSADSFLRAASKYSLRTKPSLAARICLRRICSVRWVFCPFEALGPNLVGASSALLAGPPGLLLPAGCPGLLGPGCPSFLPRAGEPGLFDGPPVL
eukprot:6475957-Amphidinium_carterae.1